MAKKESYSFKNVRAKALKKRKRNKEENREKARVTQHVDASVSMRVELAGMW